MKTERRGTFFKPIIITLESEREQGFLLGLVQHLGPDFADQDLIIQLRNFLNECRRKNYWAEDKDKDV